jgi:hypothetical protein
MRYLKCYSGAVYGKDQIEKRDLLDLKNGLIDFLINVEGQTYFDHEANEWVPIPIV